MQIIRWNKMFRYISLGLGSGLLVGVVFSMLVVGLNAVPFLMLGQLTLSDIIGAIPIASPVVIAFTIWGASIVLIFSA